MKPVRTVVFYRHYFEAFFQHLPVKAREKTDYVLFLLAHAEKVPAKFLKHLEGCQGLSAVRIEWGGNDYGIFCCFNKEKGIVLFNGFQKKTQKTPRPPMALALRLMRDYFDEGNEP